MHKKRKRFPLYEVKQILETDSIESANELLANGEWILINSYRNRQLSTKLICRLGRIADYPEVKGYTIDELKTIDAELLRKTE